MSESLFTGGWWGLVIFGVFCVLVTRWLRGGGASGRASADGRTVDGGDGGYYWMHTSADSGGGSNGDLCGDGGGSDGGGCDGGGGDGGGGD
jgi:hypothetical protein